MSDIYITKECIDGRIEVVKAAIHMTEIQCDTVGVYEVADIWDLFESYYAKLSDLIYVPERIRKSQKESE